MDDPQAFTTASAAQQKRRQSCSDVARSQAQSIQDLVDADCQSYVGKEGSLLPLWVFTFLGEDLTHVRHAARLPATREELAEVLREDLDPKHG